MTSRSEKCLREFGRPPVIFHVRLSRGLGRYGVRVFLAPDLFGAEAERLAQRRREARRPLQEYSVT
jgi:hypothetical protein